MKYHDRKERTVSKTIEVGEPNTYVVRRTIDNCYYIMFINPDRSGRIVDGNKVYPSRQNAYRRCKQLNDAIKDVDDMIDRDGAIIM
jgi:hypothetical protein